MKRIITCLAAILLIASTSSFAGKIISINKAIHFSPVNWTAGVADSGFSILNQTALHQFVQIVVNTGSVWTYNTSLSCQANLVGGTLHNFVVCTLAPAETLSLDVDMTAGGASGTYQIEMGTT